MSDYSGYLFSQPSFQEGFARIVDGGGSLNEYNVSATPAEADRIALENDWRAIGQDFGAVVANYHQEASGQDVQEPSQKAKAAATNVTRGE